MIGNFFDVFGLYKERYLQQNGALENRNAIERFEKWIKSNSTSLRIKTAGTESKKIDLAGFLARIILEAQGKLSGKGIKINSITLGLKESSRCITAFNNSNVYYRIGKTSPRKGKYRGMDFLVMELIMDGNKNNVFIPLVNRIEDLERKIGFGIERESPRVEATGKYRLKLLFPFENVDSQEEAGKYGGYLSDFIYYTRQELLKLNIS
ncbi:MAG: hypothetical protein ACOY46_03920 [Bacillota bacterium]